MDVRGLQTAIAAVCIAEQANMILLATRLSLADREISKWSGFLHAQLALVLDSGPM